MNDRVSDAVMDQLFRTTRTANRYLDKPVPESLLHEIWHLMRWGPTSANQSPARLVWCVSEEARNKLADCAMPINADKIRHAPVAVIVGMDLKFFDHLPKLFPHADMRTIFAENSDMARESAFRNSSLQGAYLIIAARMLGLDCGPMSGFDPAAVNAQFFAGTATEANFIATLGYGDFSDVYPRLPRLDDGEVNRFH